MTTTVTNDNFQAEVLDSKDVVLVDFYADWCGPCQGMLPAVNELSENAPSGTKVVKLALCTKVYNNHLSTSKHKKNHLKLN